MHLANDPTGRRPHSARGPRWRAALAAATAAAVVGALLTTAPAGAIEPAADGAYRFDFGTATSPVAPGYQQATIARSTRLQAGWGITIPAGVTLFDRYRSGSRTPADPLAEDFVAGTNWGLNVDLAAGDYDVTVTLGDSLPTASGTNATVTLEGAAQTRQTTPGGGTVTATFRTVVTDGQLTIGFTGSGLGAYVNGVVVAPVVPATPAALAVSRVAYDAVDLTWSAADGAATYDVERAVVTGDQPGTYSPVAEGVTATTFTDGSVQVGTSYAYRVVGVSAYDRSSAPSEPVRSGEIPKLAIPGAVEGLAVSRVTSAGVELTWTATPNAVDYLLERSAKGANAYSAIATLSAPGYTDADADTAQEWTYRVIARNAAGSGAASTVDSAAYVPPAPLPAGDVVTFDFGPGDLAEGALRVTTATAFDAEWGYGFSKLPTNPVADVNRDTGDALREDFVAADGATFEVDLGAGDYSIQLVAGDQQAATTTTITAEGIAKVLANPQAAGAYLQMAFPIALVDGRLTLEIAGGTAAINALTITRLPARVAGAITTAYITGDSTVQTYDPTAYAPQAGWGQMIDRFFADDIAFANHAIGGRSSKNFITQGRLDDVLRGIRPGDYLFVQFGHNDATQGVDDRYASPADYKEYLRVYVEGARQRGATPILVTPVSRRDFDPATGLFRVSFPEYVAKMKELAVEEDVLLVDLSASSRAYLDQIGPEAAKAVFLHVDPGVFPQRPAGTVDDTHFQEYGAIQMARLIAQDVAALDDPLAAEVADIEPPAAVPPAPQHLVAGAISNGGATLQWDASPTADIYKIYRQAVADPEPQWALVGMVTQTSSIVQGLAEGTGYRYQVVAVNGRGESEPSATVTFTTKQALYKYDFQLAGNPLMPGYTEITPNLGYTKERGYGFTNVAGRERRPGPRRGGGLERPDPRLRAPR